MSGKVEISVAYKQHTCVVCMKGNACKLFKSGSSQGSKHDWFSLGNEVKRIVGFNNIKSVYNGYFLSPRVATLTEYAKMNSLAEWVFVPKAGIAIGADELEMFFFGLRGY